MKVLIISQYFWPENFQINTLAKGLVKRGHDVSVLTGMPNYPAGKRFKGYGWWFPKNETYEGVKVLRLPIFARGSSSRLRLILNYLSFVFSGIFLGPFRCKDQYDVILVNGVSPITQALPGMWLRQWRDIPLVYYVLDLWPESVVAVDAMRSGFLLTGLSRFVKWIYKHCDAYFISSKPFKAKLMEQGVDESRIAYLPNSGDTLTKSDVTQEALAAELNVPPGFWVMYAGNIAMTQSVPTVLEAAKHCCQYPNIKFVMVGDGRVRKAMEEQAREQGLDNVYFVGRYPSEAMPRFFAACDALMVTLRDVPIFSLTVPARVQSFLAAGKPIIAACGEAGSQIIAEANAGVVVQPEDGAALANAIIQVSEMSESKRQIMGQNGIHYFQKHFTHDKVVDQLEKYLSVVVKGEPRSLSVTT